jgi:hypothetical protein
MPEVHNIKALSIDQQTQRSITIMSASSQAIADRTDLHDIVLLDEEINVMRKKELSRLDNDKCNS